MPLDVLFVPNASAGSGQTSRQGAGSHDEARPPGRAWPHYVYRCYDGDGRLLYVGCSKTPRKRLDGHASGSWWWPQVATVRNLVFADRDAALLRERRAIASEMPRCNVKGRWHVTQPREHWTEQDYIDFRWAITQSIDTTHGVYGINTKKLIAQIDAELMSRYGVSHLREVAA